MKKSILVVSFILMAFLLSNSLNQSQVMGDHLNPIVPDIKANGSDGPLIINSNDTLSITIELTSGGSTGNNADWWLVAATPFGLFHYRPVDGSWGPDLTYSHQGPLFNLGEFEVLNIPALPAGSYTIYFGVDMDMNSILNMNQAHYDSVTVYINGGDDLMDSDDDGIPNVLEENGYTYDFVSDSFNLWDGDPSKPCFKTDPYQTSTDGDPYPDGMEVSGLNMDRSVLPPGDHPLVAGYPNIAVTLKSYTITPIATITTSTGKEWGQEKNWNRDTYNLYEVTDETHWDLSESVSAGFQGDMPTGDVTFGYSFGESHSESHTTGTVMSRGRSIMSSYDWSQATTTDTSRAATMKLNLAAKNMGTATAYNIKVTFTLKIGGEPVASEQAKITIDQLDSGQEILWTDTQFTITLDELRKLDLWAPISIEIIGINSNIKNEDDSWNTCISSIETVCAHFYFDLGDGNTIGRMVYAHGAPEMTLREALILVAGGEEDPVEGPVVNFYTAEGILEKKPLDGWYFSFDSTTYDSISGYVQNPGFNLFDAVLTPDSIIVAKAPPVDNWPKIRWAILSPWKGEVTAYVDDYFFNQSNLEVFFVDKEGVEKLMTWNGEERHFSCDLSYDYIKDGTEKIVARNPMFDPDKPDKWQSDMIAEEMEYAQARFRDMGDGTVKDNNTGLIWLKNANALGWMPYKDACSAVAKLRSGLYGLTDKSNPGDWRLPRIHEWRALMSNEYQNPALCNTFGDGQWTEGDPFTGIQKDKPYMTGDGIDIGKYTQYQYWSLSSGYWRKWPEGASYKCFAQLGGSGKSAEYNRDYGLLEGVYPYYWVTATNQTYIKTHAYVWPVRAPDPLAKTSVKIYFNKTEWETAVAEEGGSVKTFETTAENLGKAQFPNFKDGPNPPQEKKQSHMGDWAIFDKSNTGYPFSFRLNSPQATDYGLTWWDTEFGMSLDNKKRAISIGDVKDEPNDDFAIIINYKSDPNHPVFAIGTYLRGNETDQTHIKNEYFQVFCENSYLQNFYLKDIKDLADKYYYGNSFVGVVSTDPIFFFYFNEDPDRDEIYIQDLFFGVSY